MRKLTTRFVTRYWLIFNAISVVPVSLTSSEDGRFFLHQSITSSVIS